MTDQAAQPDEFYIPATVSLQERRTRTLKSGDTFGVFDASGNVYGGPGSSDGVYYRDTRYLSGLDLLVGGERPMLLSSTLRDDNAELTCDLSNPDLYEADGKLMFEHGLLHIRRSRFLWNATCYERISVRNFDDLPRKVRFEFRFDADFTDLFESRGMHRPRHGERLAPVIDQDSVVLSYRGLDDRRRSTTLRFDPAPSQLDGHRAAFDLELAPQARTIIFLEVACDNETKGEAPRRAFLRSLFEARKRLRTESSRAAAVATSNDVFNEAMRRSICDLYMLVTDKPTGPYPYAGVPWFSAAFGRDALITALQTLWLDPAISRGVLAYLAENQATEIDAASDAEPGKILHEVRHGEMAQLREVPFRRYYGSVDSTPLFVMLAGAYVERTHDIRTATRLWPNIRAALNWMDVYGDQDGDGFIEYFRQTKEGLANQGWKDSYDSISHADGSLAEGPIALAEVQGYAYAARRAAASVARHLGHNAEADALDDRAAELKQAFEEAFWCEDIGTYALALDGKKQPCRVRASNAGHLLLTGIASPEHGKLVAEQLMSSLFFTGWGIRTLALGEARYNPMSYHNGSVWPHDNTLIAMGMARYGAKAEASRLFGAMFDACQTIELRRLPELFCGFPRRRAQAPTNYPVACSPQAWAATALPAMLQACLGLSFDPERNLVTFNKPVLPESLAEVTLFNLAVGGSRISVRLRRLDGEVAMNVLDRTGTIHATLIS
jgi:glycogen debranching enzyme